MISILSRFAKTLGAFGLAAGLTAGSGLAVASTVTATPATAAVTASCPHMSFSGCQNMSFS